MIKGYIKTMKYRDLVTVFLTAIFFMSLAYVAGVNPSVWFVPVILFVVWIFFIYKLWIEK